MGSANEEPLDRLESLANSLIMREKYSERNRLSLLVIHSIGSIIIGYLVITWGGPESFNPMISSEFAKLMLGVVPLVGGIALGGGLVFKRHAPSEALGMALILLWDIWMALGFIYGYTNNLTASPYPIIVYGILSGLMVIHLYTLYKYTNED